MSGAAKGYFARAYAGEEKLGPLYWWYGFWPAFGASAFLNLAFSVSPYEPGAGIMSLLAWKPLFVLPTVGAFSVTLVWLFRSVWRCSPNAKTPALGRAARISLYFGGPVWLPFILAQISWQAFVHFV